MVLKLLQKPTLFQRPPSAQEAMTHTDRQRSNRFVGHHSGRVSAHRVSPVTGDERVSGEIVSPVTGDERVSGEIVSPVTDDERVSGEIVSPVTGDARVSGEIVSPVTTTLA
jgi:hypothetical protein